MPQEGSPDHDSQIKGCVNVYVRVFLFFVGKIGKILGNTILVKLKLWELNSI